MDSTRNPLVALYFAVTENLGDQDGAVFAYMHSFLPVDANTTNPFSIKRVELYEPALIEQRLVAQDSVFTAEPPHVRGAKALERPFIIGVFLPGP